MRISPTPTVMQASARLKTGKPRTSKKSSTYPKDSRSIRFPIAPPRTKASPVFRRGPRSLAASKRTSSPTATIDETARNRSPFPWKIPNAPPTLCTRVSRIAWPRRGRGSKRVRELAAHPLRRRSRPTTRPAIRR